MTDNCKGCPEEKQEVCCQELIQHGHILDNDEKSKQVDAQIMQKAALVYPVLVMGVNK